MSEKLKKVEVKKIEVLKNSDSNSSDTNSKGNPLKLVRLRNRFFFMLYRYSTLVFLSSLTCLICSFMFLFIFTSQPVPPQYIPIDEDGRYIKLEPLNLCKDDADVKRFMLSAVKRMYKYDYINFADQIQDAGPFFTKDGWDEYLTEYGNSKTLFAVKENKWIVTVQPNSLPIVVKKEVVNDVCTWDIKGGIEISYVGTGGQIQTGDIYMRIVRNSVINNPEGLGILRAVFVEAKI